MFGWAPVCLGAGVGGYFALPAEMPLWGFAALAGLAAVCAAAGHRFARALQSTGQGAAGAALCTGAALIAAGLCLAGARSHMVAAPVIDWRYYGPIEGRIVDIDRASSGAMRVTLGDLDLRNMARPDLPRFARLTLHGPLAAAPPEVGQWVMTTGHLSAAPGPTEPRGFDFRRHAWFRSLGAVGYTRKPLVLLAPSQGRRSLTALRLAFSAQVQAQLAGEAGAFAAAIMTGDRSAMGQETLTDLRRANLAHLLAISGLHMGLLAGVLLGAARLLLSLHPWLALRLPVKKLAALIALAGSAGYLALSGGNIATERAFVMVAVALLAVVFERRALSLRAVAIAALIILILRPEGLTEPGFQMSFAATVALVAVFGLLRGDGAAPPLPRWIYGALTVFVSSAVAGLATAPFAAAHFNQIAHFGLIANLLSVPLMGLLVMPAAVAAAVLMPLGLAAPALWVMGLGLRWILLVADVVSGLEGAVGKIAAPPAYVLPLLTLGALFVVVWQGRARWAGALPVMAALLLWPLAERPAVLIARDGALVGVMAQGARVLSRAEVAQFTAQDWLANDGDARAQVAAAQGWRAQGLMASGLRVIHLQGKAAAERFTSCGAGEIVIANRDFAVPAVPAAPAKQAGLPQDGAVLSAASPCVVLTPHSLAQRGSVALYAVEGGLRVETAQGVAGDRPWSPPPRARRARAAKPLDAIEKGAQTARLDPIRRPQGAAAGQGQ